MLLKMRSLCTVVYTMLYLPFCILFYLYNPFYYNYMGFVLLFLFSTICRSEWSFRTVISSSFVIDFGTVHYIR